MRKYASVIKYVLGLDSMKSYTSLSPHRSFEVGALRTRLPGACLSQCQLADAGVT